MEQVTVSESSVGNPQQSINLTQEELDTIAARRTAFIARFIVLRESKRSKAHRTIELMTWLPTTSAEELAHRFQEEFASNGDNMGPVDRDIRRALAHSSRSLNHFIQEYSARATLNFIDSLIDYEKSNTLLFGGEDQPRTGGWRLPRELLKLRS